MEDYTLSYLIHNHIFLQSLKTSAYYLPNFYLFQIFPSKYLKQSLYLYRLNPSEMLFHSIYYRFASLIDFVYHDYANRKYSYSSSHLYLRLNNFHLNKSQ